MRTAPRRTTGRVWQAAAVAGLLGVLGACGGSSGPNNAPSTSDCSVAGQNAQIVAIMQSWYYWYPLLPGNVNPAAYATPQALLDALIQPQHLDRFSFILSKSASQAFFGAGQYVGDRKSVV